MITRRNRPTRRGVAADVTFARGFALLIALALPACPEGAPIAATCARVGDRCRLPDGPIGICGESLGACAEPPCLVCQSQH